MYGSRNTAPFQDTPCYRRLCAREVCKTSTFFPAFTRSQLRSWNTLTWPFFVNALTHHNKQNCHNSHSPMSQSIRLSIIKHDKCVEIYAYKIEICRSSSLLGRNVRWPHRTLPPGESQRVCRRDRQTDGRQTVTLRFSVDASSYKNKTRWLYCVECPHYSIRLEALDYLCTSCLLPAFDDA